MGKLLRRLSALLHRRRMRRELHEEMAAHLEMMPAGRRADFGSTLRLQEHADDEWGFVWLDRLRQDLTYAARQLRRSPGFTLTAIAVLSLGIGVNLAEVHLFEAALHRLQVRDPDSLVQFYRVSPKGLTRTLSFAEIEFYQRHNAALSAVITETNIAGVLHEGDSEGLQCSMVSGNFFGELGIVPAYGRLLDEQDAQPDAPPVVVLSYKYWQNHFGADPSIVLKTIRLNDRPVQVAGIAPPQFVGLISLTVPFWMPVSQYSYLTGDTRSAAALLADFSSQRTYMVGRLKPGISMDAAEAQFRLLMTQLRRQQPEAIGRNEWLTLHNVETPVSNNSAGLVAIAAIVVLVLLVLLSACANLGNMLLARGLARQREIEIRLSIGAGRWRLIRQLMTENFLLAILSSAAALLVGRMAARLFLKITDFPSNFRVATDWPIVLACIAFGLIATFAFGLAPALQTVRRGPNASRFRKILVSVQVAVSCLLLILSSYLTRSVQRAYELSITFDYSGLVLIDPAFYLHHYGVPEAREASGQIAARLRGLPGVDDVSIITIPPLRRSRIERVSSQDLFLNAVDPSYFPMMRLPVFEGRIFGPDEPDSVVISESAARKFWPNQSPLGKSILIATRPRTVSGVVKDSGVNLMANPDSVEAYVPIAPRDAVYVNLLVRTHGHPGQVVGAIHSAAALPGVTPSVFSYRSMIEAQVDSTKRLVGVFGTLGAVASLLALIGIFGLLAFTVTQRTREIGVRMALGARSPHILRIVLGQYWLPFGIGAALGVSLAALAVRILFNVVFGYRPFDPLSVVGGLLLFAAVALAASIAPIGHALRIDPASALRYE